MADVFSPAKRSEIMRNIKPRGNRSTELFLVAAFRKARIIGWRRHTRLLGRPDFTFHSERVVVFVDGDFWHGNPKNFKMPLSNIPFWEEKLRYNRAKDRRVTRELRKSGWSVIRIWESSLRRRSHSCVARVIRALTKSKHLAS
jgi:DNA mismatch endonuclease (patch repair protein)